jgi:Tfp pilus assembly protein PilE
MREFRFPWLELSIVILVGVLIYVLGYPQYKEMEEINKRYQVLVNMYTLRAAIENYAAYNEGKFPQKYEEFAKFFIPPKNPYKGEVIEAQDIKIFKYNEKDEHKAQTLDSKNGRMRGEPGGLGYGYFISPTDTTVVAYGIIGFDKNGQPLAEKLPSGKTKVYVLYE